MVDPQGVIAVIPARGGSKSIPRKNIKLLGGVPLIAYSIASARRAATVGRVIVSTDDPEIREVALACGAEVPFLRPAELAQDQTVDLPVFKHVLEWLDQHEGYRPNIVVHIRPTSPFRRVCHIDQLVQILDEHSEADAVRTVCEPFQNPFKMWKIGEDGFMIPLMTGPGPEPYNMPRQKLPKVYWQTGYVDGARWATIMELDSMTGRRIFPLVMDASDWIDIDSPSDWTIAEQLLATRQFTLNNLGLSPDDFGAYRAKLG